MNHDEVTNDVLFVIAQAHIFVADLGVDLNTIQNTVEKSKATIRTRITELESSNLIVITRKKPLTVKLTEQGRSELLPEM